MVRNRETYNAYMSDYMIRRYHSRRNQALALLGGKCVRCGTTDDLNFDHVDRDTKSFPISKLWSVSKPRFDEEIAKCQILCAPCHRDKTREFRDYRKDMR